VKLKRVKAVKMEENYWLSLLEDILQQGIASHTLNILNVSVFSVFKLPTTGFWTATGHAL